MKLLILFFLAIILTGSSAKAQFAGGSGTEEDPFQVQTLEQLQMVQNYSDKHFMQIADIDASDTWNWNDGKGFILLMTLIS